MTQRAISRDNFYLKDLSLWQGKHLITKRLLFLLPCELPSSPSTSQAQDGVPTLFCLSVFEPLVAVRFLYV